MSKYNYMGVVDYNAYHILKKTNAPHVLLRHLICQIGEFPDATPLPTLTTICFASMFSHELKTISHQI